LNLSLIPGRVRLLLILLLAFFSIAFAGRAAAQDTSLSADEIIQILQANPDVLAEAKAEIVAQLRDRGYNVTEKDITDDRLFSQIRSDDRVRQMASDELVKRGFGPQQGDESQTQDQESSQQGQPQGQNPQSQNQGQAQSQYPGQATPGPTPAAPIFGQQPARGSQTDMTRQGTRTENERPGGKGKRAGPPQEQYPLRNLPALRDLYTQNLPDETKLERFGAALFRNSAAAAEKAPLSIPVGSDYVIGLNSWSITGARVRSTFSAPWIGKGGLLCQKLEHSLSLDAH